MLKPSEFSFQISPSPPSSRVLSKRYRNYHSFEIREGIRGCQRPFKTLHAELDPNKLGARSTKKHFKITVLYNWINRDTFFQKSLLCRSKLWRKFPGPDSTEFSYFSLIYFSFFWPYYRILANLLYRYWSHSHLNDKKVPYRYPSCQPYRLRYVQIIVLKHVLKVQVYSITT